MNEIWFKPLGWFYRPVSLSGWLVSLGALAFCAAVFVSVDRHAHSVSDTFYGCYPFVTPTFLGVMWIASRSSDERGGRS